MNQIKVTKTVETICAQGCARVNELIIELDKGSKIKDTQELTQEETTAVLAELKAIMAVYDKDD